VATGDGADPMWIAGLVTVGSALAAVPALLKIDGPAALRPPTAAARPLLAVGLFLAIADLALAAAMAKGDVALVSVISSSDPVLTVAAARVVLEERVSRAQGAGVALTLTGLLAVAAA
jgi:drug/metabolite transporter (DMT)-like permease